MYDTAHREQFEQEARMLAALSHSNLPEVYDYFFDSGHPYLIMQYIEGATLDRLKEDRSAPFEVDQVLHWANDLLDALIYLHSQEPPIIHRDIKPSNVCITPEGKAVLLDFGIARRLDETRTQTGARAYSMHYAPIEQYPAEAMGSYSTLQQYLEELKAEGIHTGPHSDVYSLGATLYFALTLLDPPDACLRQLGEGQRPIRELNPDVPDFLVEALDQALIIDPRQRCQTAAELRQLLLEEPMPKSWKEELETAIRNANIDTDGENDVRQELHARVMIGVLKGYGESPAGFGFVYAKPCLHSTTMRPPSVVLGHPDVGILVIDSKGYLLDHIEGVKAGKILVRRHGFVDEIDAFKQTEETMIQIKHATEKITGAYKVPLFNFVVALPAVAESEWRVKGYDQKIDTRHLLFKEHCEHPQRFKQRVQVLVREALARTPISEPLVEEQCVAVRRAFGDSSVVNEPPRVRPVPEEKLGALIDRLVNQEKHLSEEQQELSRADFEGHPQLIRGVAGSGKTIVLANNAARFVKRRLSEPDDLFTPERRRQPRIAIVCFNRSLVSFIGKKVRQAFGTQAVGKLPNNAVTIRHLNGLFFFELNRRHGGPLAYISTKKVEDSAERAHLYQEQLQRLAREDPERYDAMLFDAVYVDEGQDFEPEEFRLLLDLIRPDKKTGEKSLVIFYDNAQNLYGRRLPTWSSDVGIDIAKGRRSRIMKQCFRNTRPIVELAFNVLLGAKAPSEMQAQTRGYADVPTLSRNNLVKELEDRWQVNFTERTGPPPRVREFSYRTQEKQWVAEEITRLIEKEQVKPEDIIVLCRTRDEATEFGHFIEQRKQSFRGLNFPFERDKRDDYIFREHHLTVSTIHSAKGYDAWVAFLPCVDQYDNDVEGRAMFYVGATRAKLLLNISGVSRPRSLLREARQVHKMLFD
jgi:superfamily I DNA and RNA helicase/tRNA A-37 threonylcarbamoyl transferase component Bud32